MLGSRFTQRCIVPGCPNTVQRVRISFRSSTRYCNRHRKAYQRRLDPEQHRIWYRDLQPCRREIELVIRHARDREKMERKLAEIVEILQEQATSYLVDLPVGRKRYQHMQSHMGWQAQAADIIRNVLQEVSDPVKVAVHVGAVYLLRHRQPRLFHSDDGFQAEVVRQFRRLGPMSSGSYWSEKRERVEHHYVMVPPKVIAYLAAVLHPAYTPWAGFLISKIERRDERSTKDFDAPRLKPDADELVSRAEAKRLGYTHYRLASCPKGHQHALRSVRTRECTECHAARLRFNRSKQSK